MENERKQRREENVGNGSGELGLRELLCQCRKFRQTARCHHRPVLQAPRTILKLRTSRRPSSWLRAGSLACVCWGDGGGTGSPALLGLGISASFFRVWLPCLCHLFFCQGSLGSTGTPKCLFLLPCCRLLLISMEYFSYPARYFS